MAYIGPLKICVVGDSSVGKSSLIATFQGRPFSETLLPAPASVGTVGPSKNVVVSRGLLGSAPPSLSLGLGAGMSPAGAPSASDSISVEYWDQRAAVPATERASFYAGARFVLLMYDTTQRFSFESACQKHLRDAQHHSPDAVLVLIGCKSDLVLGRAVSIREAETFSTAAGIFFMEVSSKEHTNIDLILKILRIRAQHIVKRLSAAAVSSAAHDSALAVSVSQPQPQPQPQPLLRDVATDADAPKPAHPPAAAAATSHTVSADTSDLSSFLGDVSSPSHWLTATSSTAKAATNQSASSSSTTTTTTTTTAAAAAASVPTTARLVDPTGTSVDDLLAVARLANSSASLNLPAPPRPKPRPISSAGSSPSSHTDKDDRSNTDTPSPVRVSIKLPSSATAGSRDKAVVTDVGHEEHSRMQHLSLRYQQLRAELARLEMQEAVSLAKEANALMSPPSVRDPSLPVPQVKSFETVRDNVVVPVVTASLLDPSRFSSSSSSNSFAGAAVANNATSPASVSGNGGSSARGRLQPLVHSPQVLAETSTMSPIVSVATGAGGPAGLPSTASLSSSGFASSSPSSLAHSTSSPSSTTTTTTTTTASRILRQGGQTPPKEPQLYVDVNIGDGRVGQIGVRDGDNPYQLAETFVRAFRLDQSCVRKLAVLIQTRVQEYWTDVSQRGFRDPALGLLSSSSTSSFATAAGASAAAAGGNRGNSSFLIDVNDGSSSSSSSSNLSFGQAGTTLVKPFRFRSEDRSKQRRSSDVLLRLHVDVGAGVQPKGKKFGQIAVRKGDDPGVLARNFAQTFGLRGPVVLEIENKIREQLLNFFIRESERRQSSLSGSTSRTPERSASRSAGAWRRPRVAGAEAGVADDFLSEDWLPSPDEQPQQQQQEEEDASGAEGEGLSADAATGRILFYLEVDVGRSSVVRLGVRENEDAARLAASFVSEHGLSEEARWKLESLIARNLYEYHAHGFGSV